MRPGSLRLRLYVAAAISIAVALVPTGFGLLKLFEQQVRERIVLSLKNDLLQLAGGIEMADDGTLKVEGGLSDPRYLTPYGQDSTRHRYWQVTDAAIGRGGQDPSLVRSPSLWDFKIDPANPVGPTGDPLIVAGDEIMVRHNNGFESVWLLAAAEEGEVQEILSDLRTQILFAFLAVGVVLSTGTWFQVSVGLSPLKQLRTALTAIRRGTAQRLSGSFPAEVAPLVSEFNDVLDLRDTSLERARRRAGDLAHGLKTPLTVLSTIARQLRKSGQETIAADIEEQSEAMLRHVERALVRARLSSGKGHAASDLLPAVQRVVAAVERLPGAEVLRFDILVPRQTQVLIEQRDLTELLGNLLDNARKWAEACVRVRYAPGVITIEDDGPGVQEGDLACLGQRGRRLDESKQGSGLGLSIVEDIADLYGLSVTYGRSELGGLKVQIRV